MAKYVAFAGVSVVATVLAGASLYFFGTGLNSFAVASLSTLTVAGTIGFVKTLGDAVKTPLEVAKLRKENEKLTLEIESLRQKTSTI